MESFLIEDQKTNTVKFVYVSGYIHVLRQLMYTYPESENGFQW